MCENIFQIYCVRIPENVLNIGIFTHGPHHSKLAQTSCHYTQGRRKLLIPPGRTFFKNLFSPTTEKH